jgi:hypothetical protein
VFKNIKNFGILFLSIIFMSLIINYFFYKKYKITFNVSTNDLPRVETIAFNQKNIDNPLYSSIRYSRNSQYNIEIFLLTNDLDEGVILINDLRMDFVNYYDHVSARYYNFTNQYFTFKNDPNLFSKFLTFSNFFEKNNNLYVNNNDTIMEYKKTKDEKLKSIMNEFKRILEKEKKLILKYNISTINDIANFKEEFLSTKLGISIEEVRIIKEKVNELKERKLKLEFEKKFLVEKKVQQLQKKLEEYGYDKKTSIDFAELIHYIIKYYNASAVSDIKIEIINKKIFNYVDLIVIFIFSIIGHIYINKFRKTNF